MAALAALSISFALATARAQPEPADPEGDEPAAGDAGQSPPTDTPPSDGSGSSTPDGASEPSDTAAAEALFLLGKALMDTGQLDEACNKLAESMRAEPAGGTLLNLALCHQQQGKLASAWAEYRKAAELIRATGQQERADEALRLAVDLEPKLSKLTVLVSQPVRAMQVLRGGVKIGTAVYGVAVPVDPGVYRIEASAPGYRDWSASVTVGSEGDRQAVSVPALEPLAEQARAGPQAKPADPSRTDYRVPYFTGIVMAAVGGAAVGIGAVLGGVAASEIGDAESDPALCGEDKLCTPEGQDVVDGARDKATAATLLIGVGAATVVSGFVLVLTTGTFRTDAAPEEAAEQAVRSPRLVPVLGPGHAGVSLTGWF
ncbi:MAG: tetratricopeptide repeat protein [Deltaproteobacteria bacterium]|jgi:hypothetical protein|nr:tetratricopeptide repeat protein [Deltaproteobacteria bacterium]MBW2529987.1 tetratricopeptide repeat protein [Deltaproteobacteria bacterium]